MTLALAAKLAVALVALYFWARAVHLLLLLPRHKKPEVSWAVIPGAGINPYNIILYPRHLTKQGQQNLFWAVIFAVVFVAICGLFKVASLLGI